MRSVKDYINRSNTGNKGSIVTDIPVINEDLINEAKFIS
jgi:hypothetical protein